MAARRGMTPKQRKRLQELRAKMGRIHTLKAKIERLGAEEAIESAKHSLDPETKARLRGRIERLMESGVADRTWSELNNVLITRLRHRDYPMP